VRKDLFRQGDEEGDEEYDERVALSKSPKSPAREVTTLGQQGTSDTGLSTTLSPKMSRLMGSKASLKVVTGYFGPFTFLDNQVAFDTVFAATSEYFKDASVLKEDIDDFFDNCKFDIFMVSCRSYYVGVGNRESDIQATHAACKSICELRMEEKVSGRIIVLNPDVLFSKFMEITPLLPDDASKWSTQLCSAYSNALTPEFNQHNPITSFNTSPNARSNPSGMKTAHVGKPNIQLPSCKWNMLPCRHGGRQRVLITSVTLCTPLLKHTALQM